MTIFTNTVPQWISALFVISFIIPIFMIANVVQQGALKANIENDKTKTLQRNEIIFFATYYIYVALMSFTGVFQLNTLPPRILVFT